LKSAYRKFTDRVALDAAHAASAAASVELFSWLTGHWLWRGNPVHFALAPYGISLQPAGRPFLIHNAASGLWLLVLSDPAAFGILIGPEPRAGTARFSGHVTIGRKSVELHQIWRRIDEETIEVEDERRNGEHWQLWDRSRLQRVKPSN
jgi:hypothetical protein